MKTTNFYQVFRRKIRTVTLAVMTFAMAVTGTLFSMGGIAHADVDRGSIAYLSLELGSPGANMQARYDQFIDSLRAVAGHNYRDGERQTQLIPRIFNVPNHYQNGLIRVDLTNAGTRLIVWITPGDLYVRGFTNQNGFTYQFNDEDYNLLYHFSQVSGAPAGGGATLSFGSNYNSISGVNAANRGREAMPISFNDMWNSVFNLAYTTSPYGGNQENVARSLMFMIQMLSESARFHDVYGIMSDIMHSYNSFYNGLPMLQQRLENSWNSISEFGFNITANPSTPPRNIVGVGTLYSWNDVMRYLALMVNNNNLDLEEVKGDWWHTEL